MAGSIYGVSQINEITPNLFLTSVYGATRENIQRKGISLLVNAAQELPKQEITGVESIKLFLDDSTSVSISQYFDRIADKINEHSQNGGRSLVHCVLGVSRSTTLCLAYLMKYKNMSLKSAFDYVSARRPCVRPNAGFWRQLVEYEKSLNNSSSAGSSSGYLRSDTYSGGSSLSSNYGQYETSIPISYSSSPRASKKVVASSSNRLNSLYGNNYSSLSAPTDYSTAYNNDLDYDFERTPVPSSNSYSKSYISNNLSSSDFDTYDYGYSRSSAARTKTYRESYGSNSSYSSPFSSLSSSSNRYRSSIDTDPYGPSYTYSEGASPFSYKSNYGLRF